LYFEFGKHNIPEGEKWRLEQIVEYLNAGAPVKKIQINGYTDQVGIRRYNRWLSNKRAEAIRNYLITKGVSASVTKIKGYGERSPVYNNRTAKGRSLNRRVDILLIR
jgi:outer membrane protein OmpA-like peptidoglycan-associated protein